ncbi:MAG: MBL fold metallo-hydrolase, partial [Pyrinomonadaceae bacterium]
AVVEALRYGERRDYGRYALTFYPAGPCRGSAQVLIEADGERLVYTGDFKLRPNVAAETAVIIACDTLVMESTFGDPHYKFPPEVTIVARLHAAVDRALSDNRVPVVLAYALGKSQEALEMPLRGNYRVTLHGAVWGMTEVYRELGVRFSGEYEKYDRERLRGRVLIAPPNCRKQPMITNINSRYVIMLTGWALHKSAPYMYKNVDLVLPLSDHADFDDLVRAARVGRREDYHHARRAEVRRTPARARVQRRTSRAPSGLRQKRRRVETRDQESFHSCREITVRLVAHVTQHSACAFNRHEPACSRPKAGSPIREHGVGATNNLTSLREQAADSVYASTSLLSPAHAGSPHLCNLIPHAFRAGLQSAAC